MHGKNSINSASWRRWVKSRSAVLAIGLVAMASTAEAKPFAYVTNQGANTVSVIDTDTNAVVVTVPVGNNPYGWPVPRTENTPMSRTKAPIMFR